MATIGDPDGTASRQVPARKPNVDWGGYRERQTDTSEPESPHHSGSFLLASLMWSAYTVSVFLLMLGVIVPTWGNVFIVLVFLIVALGVSFARNGGKT